MVHPNQTKQPRTADTILPIQVPVVVFEIRAFEILLNFCCPWMLLANFILTELYSANPTKWRQRAALVVISRTQSTFPMKNVYIRIGWRVLNEILLLYGVFLCVRWVLVNLYHGNEVKVAARLVLLYVGGRIYMEIRKAMSVRAGPARPPSSGNEKH